VIVRRVKDDGTYGGSIGFVERKNLAARGNRALQTITISAFRATKKNPLDAARENLTDLWVARVDTTTNVCHATETTMSNCRPAPTSPV
jgi:hypothetical protein